MEKKALDKDEVKQRRARSRSRQGTRRVRIDAGAKSGILKCRYLFEKDVYTCAARKNSYIPSRSELNECCGTESHRKCSLYLKAPLWRKVIFEA